MEEIFILTAGLISLFSIFSKKKISNLYFWIILFFLIIFDGLRWNMGTDWESYFDAFTHAQDQIPTGFEIGFAFYMKFIRTYTDNYSLFLIITTAFFYIGIFYQVFKLTNKSYFSIYFLLGTITWYSGALRQMIACVFFIFLLSNTINRKFYSFVFNITIASLFHTTSLLFIFIYFIYGLNISLFLIFYIVIIFLIFIFKSQLTTIATLAEIYGTGKDYSLFLGGSISENQGNPLFGFLRKIYTYGIFLFSVLFLLKRNLNTLFEKKLLFFFYLSLFSIITYFIGTFFISGFSSRVDIYVGIITTSILIGLIEKQIQNKLFKLIYFIFITSLILLFYSRLDHMYLFHPYSSIFFNKDIIR